MQPFPVSIQHTTGPLHCVSANPLPLPATRTGTFDVAPRSTQLGDQVRLPHDACDHERKPNPGAQLEGPPCDRQTPKAMQSGDRAAPWPVHRAGGSRPHSTVLQHMAQRICGSQRYGQQQHNRRPQATPGATRSAGRTPVCVLRQIAHDGQYQSKADGVTQCLGSRCG